MLSIDYKLPDGTQKHQDEVIEVPIKGKSELGFVSVDTSPRRVSAGEPFDLTIRIENTGTGEAKQVAATIDLPMTGTRQSFIGKIKPGNDAPAVFMLDGGKSGTYEYNTSITTPTTWGLIPSSTPCRSGFLRRITPVRSSWYSSLSWSADSSHTGTGTSPVSTGTGPSMGKKELKVAFLLSLRSLQRGSRASTFMTVLIISLCFTNMIFLPGLFNGIGQGITTQIVDYEVETCWSALVPVTSISPTSMQRST